MALEIAGGLIVLLDSLTYAAPAPTIHFDDAPLKYTPPGGGAAVLIAPPYIVLVNESIEPESTFEARQIETANFRVEIFANSLAECESICAVVRLNGGAVDAYLGLDFANTLSATNHQDIAVVRKRMRFAQEADRSQAAKIVFRCSMEYQVTSQRIG